MTYRTLINLLEKKGIEKESIILLITEKLNISKYDFYLSLDKELDSNIIDDINQLENNVPVQYILGYTYFYKYKFKVNKNVLIPRFDTEVLIEQAIKIIKEKDNPKVIDIGTGSGCIAITLKKEIPSLNIYASDISKEALEVAKDNAILNNVNINFFNNDLLNNISCKYDIIISNPPYIAYSEDIMDLVKNNEPSLALFSPNDGLYHYDQILKQSKERLNNKGIIIFEIPSGRDEEIKKLVLKYYNNYEIIKDYNNLSRVLIIRS